ncbi:UNVERIFIED_CONTAM: hypothetical protein RF653_17535 [Kocuria sp. CPCC 205316]|uniref:hypothetical protein n=1 Tax=Kocuria TaxID=57493 RepID=UPI0036DC4DCF
MFTDPVSPVFGASSAAAFGALSWIDPSRLSPARRRAYRVGVAATTAWWAGVTTDQERTALVPANVVAGVAAGAAVLALSDASETLDARIVGRLEAAGVRHPRRWLAAASVASVVVGYAVDRAGARAEAQALEVGEEPVRTRALTPAVRAVVQGILQATDTAEARVLLGQLAVAQESYFDDGVQGFSTTVEFQVPDDVVRVVPHHQTYPVRAQCHAPNGTQLQISLQLMEGKLSHLAIDFADEAHFEDESAIDVVEELLDQWPDASDLRYLHEGPDGHLLPLT